IIMNEFYSGLEVNENDKLLECLNLNVDSEKIFIKFKNIIKGIKDIEGINVSDVGKIVGSGRVNFYTKIYKDSWLGEDTANLVDGNYKVTKNSYDIHIEPSFDVFNNKITLPLHYETRPYIPKNKLREKTNTEDYEEYINKRNLIKVLVHKKISEMNDERIKPYNGSNQIAYVKIDVDENTTVEDFKTLVKKYILILSEIIDSCLE
ncbi:MAG: hypothetical protein KZY57_07900, partial [Paeniclostridium sp.]